MGQDVLVYTGRDQERRTRDLSLPPVLTRRLETTWEMEVEVGSGMGRKEEVS